MEVDARFLPVPLHRALRYVSHGGNFPKRKSAKETSNRPPPRAQALLGSVLPAPRRCAPALCDLPHSQQRSCRVRLTRTDNCASGRAVLKANLRGISFFLQKRHYYRRIPPIRCTWDGGQQGRKLAKFAALKQASAGHP